MIREARVEDLPIILVGIEHDGPGAFLAKQAKKPKPIRYPNSPRVTSR